MLEETMPKKAKKKINSRAKGCRGEREWRDVLRDHGWEARRGQQFSGDKSAPDVISELDWIHWEVKRVEKLNIDVAMAQAIKDASGYYTPIVAHRRDGKEWLVTLQASEFLILLQEVERGPDFRKEKREAATQAQGTRSVSTRPPGPDPGVGQDKAAKRVRGLR